MKKNILYTFLLLAATFFTFSKAKAQCDTYQETINSSQTHGETCDIEYSVNNSEITNEGAIGGDPVVTINNTGNTKDEVPESYSVIQGNLTVSNASINISEFSVLIITGDLILDHGSINYTYSSGNGTSKPVYLVVLGNVNGVGSITTNTKTGNGSQNVPIYVESGNVSPQITGNLVDDAVDDSGTDGVESVSNLPDNIATIVDAIKNGADLPVELISFTSKVNDNSVDLNWSTASEFNASHFIIEKSSDNSNWEEIGKIDAAGNSTTIKSYAFTDNEFGNAVSYYRLVQVDFDGKSEIFGPLTVYPKGLQRNLEVMIFPNPSVDKLNLQLSGISEGMEFEITVLDKLGKVVFAENSISENNSFIYDLNRHLDVQPGNYFLMIRSGSQKVSTRFVKQ
ncbi:T9SS type A sorting domain-containing protein [Flammeovirga sp. MY04]|uniref:T9SS type A sorting domain-containing protein n=1 Tax=Flammeovirga sp. MY04 TaxID=1191459 RepID=UPI000806154A|nr:T9SS type A sorting domain-containing protein [Flammeovirga sp. MY04]ANQ51277.1 T9SS type A sorting domain-containing protein [Flammeovirga sp. MY04]